MTISFPIYLDNNATTAVDPVVLQAMLPTFSEHYGNPSSTAHSYGWYAQELVTIAREKVAHAIGAAPHEIIFTSGATESNNTVIQGLAQRTSGGNSSSGAFVSAVTEHHSVLEAFAFARNKDIPVVLLAVNSQGGIFEEELERQLEKQPALISLMIANNEIGTLHDIKRLAQRAHDVGALFHSDGTQALGKMSIDVNDLGVDFMSLSAHKVYGPKGIGALYVRDSVSPRVLQPLLRGAGQEAAFRSGTLNVPGIVGFGAACERAVELLKTESVRVRHLTEKLYQGILTAVPDVILNGPELTKRLAGNLNFSFPNLDIHAVIGGCGGKLAVSLAAACSSTTGQASHVIEAIYPDRANSPSAVRIGIGRFNTDEDVEAVVNILSDAVRKLR